MDTALPSPTIASTCDWRSDIVDGTTVTEETPRPQVQSPTPATQTATVHVNTTVELDSKGTDPIYQALTNATKDQPSLYVTAAADSALTQRTVIDSSVYQALNRSTKNKPSLYTQLSAVSVLEQGRGGN